MFQQDEDDLEIPGAPAPGGAPPVIAPPPVDPLADIRAQQDAVNKKKAMLGVFGGIGQALADRPSGYELYTGKKSARPDVKGMFDAAAGGISDPMSSEQKAFAYLKAKNEGAQALGQSKFRDSLQKDDSDTAKAFKLAAGVPEGMSALDALDQGYSPAKLGEIKAKAAIDFGNQKAIHQMDNDASIKKYLLEEGIRQKDKKEIKKDENDNKDAVAMGGDLEKGWVGRSGQAGQVQGKILAAERVEALLNQAKTQTGGLDSRQTEELSQSVANMLGGGSPASARVEELVPHSLYGKMAKAKEYITGTPQGLGQGAFTERLAETVAREKALAQKQMQEYQMQTLSKHDRLSKSNPELYSKVLADHGITPDSVQQFKAKGTGLGNGPGEFVNIRAPDGSIRKIPKEKQADALAAGGSLVDAGSVAGGH